MNKEIIVNSRKYDGSLHRSWNCELVSFDGEKLELKGSFAETVEHSQLGILAAGTVLHEYFWLSRWYNVFRFENLAGGLQCHYLNITQPPTFDGSTLEFVDLDIDIVAWPDGRIEVLDEDEFAENSRAYGYPRELIDIVNSTKDSLFRIVYASDWLV